MNGAGTVCYIIDAWDKTQAYYVSFELPFDLGTLTTTALTAIMSEIAALLSISTSREVISVTYVSASVSLVTIEFIGTSATSSAASPRLLATELVAMLSTNSTSSSRSAVSNTVYMKYATSATKSVVVEPTSADYTLFIWIVIPMAVFLLVLAIMQWCVEPSKPSLKKEAFTLLIPPLAIYEIVSALLYVKLLHTHALTGQLIAYIIFFVVPFVFNALASLIHLHHHSVLSRY
jgi:hypothetical protein